jgi:hypothetical protein
MSYEPLMDAIVQVIIFAEQSSDDILDQDAAVELMERLAATLQRLQPTEKIRFLEYLQQRATHAMSANEREWILSMGSNLGLVS